MHAGGDPPGDGGGVEGSDEGPAPGASLVFDGYDGGDAGEVEEDEEEVAVGGERCEVVDASEHTDGRCYDFLRSDTCDEADVELPVETLQGEDGFDEMSHVADEAVLDGRGDASRAEVAECPDDDAGDEDDAAHLLQVFLAFLPCVAADGFACGPAVGRQFHHKRSVLAS